MNRVFNTLYFTVTNITRSLTRPFIQQGGTKETNIDYQSIIPRPTSPIGITTLSIIEHLTQLYPTAHLVYNFFPTDDGSLLVTISRATGNNVYPFVVNHNGQIQLIGVAGISTPDQLYVEITNYAL
jgi:hypothetical protein